MPGDSVVTDLDRAVETLSAARRVVAFTGAGMSAESGVPTFRDALTGLWSRFDPQELATERAFRTNPARVFGWYMSRLRAVRRVEPHAGYDALVRMAGLFDGLPVVTQNVDGLHQRAGSAPVVELHGSLGAFRCAANGHPFPIDRVIGIAESSGAEEVDPPPCESCGSAIRPGVVWFGEMLPPEAVERAWNLARDADVFLVLGTSSVVYPAAELPQVAKAGGARVIEVNPEPTPLTARADFSFRDAAGPLLGALVEQLVPLREHDE